MLTVSTWLCCLLVAVAQRKLSHQSTQMCCCTLLKEHNITKVSDLSPSAALKYVRFIVYVLFLMSKDISERTSPFLAVVTPRSLLAASVILRNHTMELPCAARVENKHNMHNSLLYLFGPAVDWATPATLAMCWALSNHERVQERDQTDCV